MRFFQNLWARLRHRRHRHHRVTTSIGVYVNPFRQVNNLRPERIDMGVDYAGSGPLLALGNAIVGVALSSNSGWPGGGFVGYTLLDGPYVGKHVYMAENFSPTVRAGQRVSAGQEIGVLHD